MKTDTVLSTRTRPWRFVWRHLDGDRWRAVTFQAVDPHDAVQAMRKHIEATLKRPIDQVVVDHFFREQVPGLRGNAAWNPYSLRGLGHPFTFEFNNTVFPPPATAPTTKPTVPSVDPVLPGVPVAAPPAPMRTREEAQAALNGPSIHRSGAGCVERVLRRVLNRDLTIEQAEKLWTECKAYLVSQKDRSTVREIEAATDGGLDTWPREGLMDAIGHVMAGSPWPANMTGREESEAFFDRLVESSKARGHVRLLGLEELALMDAPPVNAKARASRPR